MPHEKNNCRAKELLTARKEAASGFRRKFLPGCHVRQLVFEKAETISAFHDLAFMRFSFCIARSLTDDL
jgi:hypothetical protein